MGIFLAPARTAQLFAAIEAQQQQFLTEQRPVPLPRCPACRRRPSTITIAADGSRVSFTGCGHGFRLTREAMLAGLAAQRTA